MRSNKIKNLNAGPLTPPSNLASNAHQALRKGGLCQRLKHHYTGSSCVRLEDKMDFKKTG